MTNTRRSMTLHGAKLADHFDVSMVTPGPVVKEALHIVHAGPTKYAPVRVVLAKKDSPGYLVNAREAIEAPELMAVLSQEDRQRIEQLACLNPSQPDYSKWVFVEC